MSLERPVLENKPLNRDAPDTRRDPVTIRTIRDMARRGDPFACLACYDAISARWLERAGVHVLLAGDSAAEIVLGLPRTIHMPLELSIWLTAALKRGAPSTLVMADMPFMSYQTGDDQGVTNAGRFMTEGTADIVKIEADASFAPLTDRLTRAGIPVCAHVGSLPQRAAMRGGYSSAGRTADQAQHIINDAIALEAAGAAMILIEAVPNVVADTIIDRTKVPVIGIGAGPKCHGQILVLHDLLGLTDHAPRFADPTASMGRDMVSAVQTWLDRVARREVGARPYTMPPDQAQRLERALKP